MTTDPKKVKGWEADFKTIADIDGYITRHDLEVYWQRANKNPSREDLDNAMTLVGLAETMDGRIGLEEFLKIQQEVSAYPFFHSDNEAVLIEALKDFDTDKDGTISLHELKRILANYKDDEEFEEAVAKSTAKGDNKISIEKLAHHLTISFTSS